jgi:hypothetical protein
MTRPRRISAALAAALLLALTACGTERSAPTQADVPEQRQEQEPSAASAPSDERLISCDARPPGWPPSAMTGGIDSRVPRDELTHALEAVMPEAGIDAPLALQGVDIGEAPWFVLAESERYVVVATGTWDEHGPSLRDDGQAVRLERKGSGWKVVGWGGCSRLVPVVEPGRQWVQVESAIDLDPAATEVVVEITERQCTGGRDPRPFLDEPTYVEDDDSVTVLWTSRMPEGASTCIGNPPVPHRLRLDEPLGDRQLLDGSSWPARPVPRRG